MRRVRVTLTREEVCTVMNACEHVIEYYEENEGWGNVPAFYPELREKMRGILIDLDLHGKRAA